MSALLTVGHGTLGRDALARLLRHAGIGAVVDVRRYPSSRHNPDVTTEALQAWLPAEDISYRWDERLGGRRRLPGDYALDTWWQVYGLRAYAAHMRTAEFRAGMDELLAGLDGALTAVMCAESVWWRCHRRLISDAAVLLHRVDVRHLGHDGQLAPHQPAPGARVTDAGLVYDRLP